MYNLFYYYFRFHKLAWNWSVFWRTTWISISNLTYHQVHVVQKKTFLCLFFTFYCFTFIGWQNIWLWQILVEEEAVLSLHLYHLHKFSDNLKIFLFLVIPSVVDRLGDAKKVVSDIYTFFSMYNRVVYKLLTKLWTLWLSL